MDQFNALVTHLRYERHGLDVSTRNSLLILPANYEVLIQYSYCTCINIQSEMVEILLSFPSGCCLNYGTSFLSNCIFRPFIYFIGIWSSLDTRTRDQVGVSYFCAIHINWRLEIRLVWKSAWNYTKVLFLLTRYLAVMISGLVVYGTWRLCRKFPRLTSITDQIWSDVSPETCEKTYPLSCCELVLVDTDIF